MNSQNATEKTIQTFSEQLLALAGRFDLATFFDNLLTLALASFARDSTGCASIDKAVAESVLKNYEGTADLRVFSSLLDTLVTEMSNGRNGRNDILGTFYEQHLAPRERLPILMSYETADLLIRHMYKDKRSPKNIADMNCTTGRVLLAAARYLGSDHSFYGMHTDPVCVKITAINLFLNGVHEGEVVCADPFNPDSFLLGYVLSSSPIGVYRIKHKEESKLWQQLREK